MVSRVLFVLKLISVLWAVFAGVAAVYYAIWFLNSQLTSDFQNAVVFFLFSIESQVRQQGKGGR